MTLFEAAKIRISRRAYIPELLSDEKKSALQKIIDGICERSGLRIILMENGEDCFSLMKSYGMFSGVKSYFALAGRADDERLHEKVGYYGEELVLEATRLGLGTCWVAGSYDKASTDIGLADGEALVCVISVGEIKEAENLKEKFISGIIKTKRKSASQMSKNLDSSPEWFKKGMDCVVNAPSARNMQPVVFEYTPDGVGTELLGSYSVNRIDLGIAEYHFELGSGKRITDFN